MSTAGLSRAYAVLRQLDVLRAESITNPLPMSGDRRARVRSEERGGSEVGRSLFRSREESAVSPSRLAGATDHRGYSSKHPHTYAPVRSHLIPASPTHDEPQAEASRPAAAERDRHAAAATTMPSPVVLPSSFTSEAAHMAAAQTSSLLEVYFDKDDMHAVLDSVAAATAAAKSPAQPGTEAAATTEAAVTPSSLSNSSLMAMPGGDAQSASDTSLVAAADDGRHPLWQLSMSRNDVGDKQHRCRSAAVASAASLSTRVKDVSITPSVEPLADRMSEGVGDDGSGGAGESEAGSPLGLHGLSEGRTEEGRIDQDAHQREDKSLPLRALLGAAGERPVQRAAVDDGHQRRGTHRPSQNDSRGQGVACGERRRVMPLLPAAYTKAVPFLDYLARVNAASSHQLLKELAAMGDAWATTTQAEDAARAGGEHPEVTEPVVVDCLAMDLLLNKPDALEYIVVPWLRTRLESMMATHSADRMNSSARKHRGRGKAVAANPLRRTGESEAEGVDEGDAAANNSVLCAVIGLGPVAFTLLPTLLQLLIWLPPPSPTSMCDVRLVGLAIRTAGGADGLEAVIRIVQQQAEGPHVLAAAAYALGTYSFELVGHTSVLCVPAGAMRRPDAKGGADSLFQLAPDDLSASPADSLSASPMMEELRPLFGRDPLLFSPTATTAAPTGRHLLYLQSPPPYRPTHVMVDAELARCELLAYLRSDQFRVTHAHPYVMALLNDALSARLLSAVVTPAAQSLYSPTISRLRRDLHRVLAEGAAGTAPHQRGNDDGSDVDEKGAAAHALLRLPLLPYSLDRFFAEEKDMLFALESALVHALLAPSATPLVQEQALMSLSTLPPVARVHVVQPVTDFFIRSARTLQLRQATTMRRSVAQAGRTDPPATGRGPRNGAREADADDNVTVAAAIAAGTVCVNPLAPSSCVDSCVASLVPVFQELLYSPLWRVRHAACVGLACVGPLTADPSSIVDFLLTCLVLHAPLVTEESGSSQAPSAAATRSPELPLQSATVVWCLAQQRQGGARALLQLLQDPQQPSQVHHWCAFQLAEVDVREACAKLNRGKFPEADALLDEMVQVLSRLIVTQGALEEDTVLLCVRALAEVVYRHYVNARTPASTAAAMDAVLSLDTALPAQEAATCCQEEEPNACYIVLTSVLESALLPTNVLKALCLYLCRYGGGHGELYACKALLQSSSVAVRTAAAFGLRACGAKVLRSVVLGMNDDSFDVRRESFETLTAIGAAAALEVLHQRPAEHRYQVQAALRDCLLQDASRPVPRKAAETLYCALVSEEPLAAQELS
ncbi:hypothetical protein CGC20_12815 [Leishmania donovani]|uniref:Uncharacterized protein n=1 Tax=Leishmania donovani TaxID=5661 RepID=A0A504WXF7_LEIDO|nr:hypothetical protein CGC20_12815 [Leishmania donovani]